MSRESCDSTGYNSKSPMCRWFCREGRTITRRRKRERKAERRQERSIVSEPQTEVEREYNEIRAKRGNPMVAALPLPCFGEYDDSVACLSCGFRIACTQGPITAARLGPAPHPRCYGEFDGTSAACLTCGFQTECSRCPHEADSYGASSSFVAHPTSSSAVDTEATTVEGGSNMNSKDLATRKKKAQDLEVTSVGKDFMVKSSTRQGGYMVTAREEGGHHCACMDFATHRGDPDWTCKHIIAVEEYLEKRGPTNGDSRYDIIDIE